MSDISRDPFERLAAGRCWDCAAELELESCRDVATCPKCGKEYGGAELMALETGRARRCGPVIDYWPIPGWPALTMCEHGRRWTEGGFGCEPCIAAAFAVLDLHGGTYD